MLKFEDMERLGDYIKDRNIILDGADIITQRGFTMVPNHVLISKKISPGAKLAYAMLLKYRYHNDEVFPGQARLAEEIGVSKRSVVTFIKELSNAKFITVSRRGQGRSNLYKLHLKVPRKH